MLALTAALAAAAVRPPPKLWDPLRHGGEFRDLTPSAAAVARTMALPLDHFNTSDTRTIDIRYWTDASQYKGAGSGGVFIAMGGEGPAGPSRPNAECQAYGGVMLSIEHRYYGASLPKLDEPLSKANLEYLSTQQYLEDAAAIVTAVKQEFKLEKAIAFGGSYSGAACAWFRVFYPDLVTGCVAKSAPVNTIVDFVQYDERMTKASMHPDPQCTKNIRYLTDAAERAAATPEGMDALKKRFNASNLIGTKWGDGDFFYGLADEIASLIQYGSKLELCSYLAARVSDQSTDEEYLAAINDLIYTRQGDKYFTSVYYDSALMKVTLDAQASDNGKQWHWQKCTSVGYYQVAPDVAPLRSGKYVTYEHHRGVCEYVFDFTAEEVESRQAAFHKKFTDEFLAEPYASQVFFINYSDDQWQEASVVTTDKPGFQTCYVTCDGCAHCGAGAGSYADECNQKALEAVGLWLKC